MRVATIPAATSPAGSTGNRWPVESSGSTTGGGATSGGASGADKAAAVADAAAVFAWEAVAALAASAAGPVPVSAGGGPGGFSPTGLEGVAASAGVRGSTNHLGFLARHLVWLSEASLLLASFLCGGRPIGLGRLFPLVLGRLFLGLGCHRVGPGGDG